MPDEYEIASIYDLNALSSAIDDADAGGRNNSCASLCRRDERSGSRQHHSNRNDHARDFQIVNAAGRDHESLHPTTLPTCFDVCTSPFRLGIYRIIVSCYPWLIVASMQSLRVGINTYHCRLPAAPRRHYRHDIWVV
jgi:hypothetical protein